MTRGEYIDLVNSHTHPSAGQRVLGLLQTLGLVSVARGKWAPAFTLEERALIMFAASESEARSAPDAVKLVAARPDLIALLVAGMECGEEVVISYGRTGPGDRFRTIFPNTVIAEMAGGREVSG